MKIKNTTAIACFLVIAIISSCKKQELPAMPAPSDFSAVLQQNAPFPAEGGKDTVIVNGNTNGWWVTLPDNDWVVVSKKYGSGNFKLPVSVKPNATGEDRAITVTINPTFGLKPVSIELKQLK